MGKKTSYLSPSRVHARVVYALKVVRCRFVVDIFYVSTELAHAHKNAHRNAARVQYSGEKTAQVLLVYIKYMEKNCAFFVPVNFSVHVWLDIRGRIAHRLHLLLLVDEGGYFGWWLVFRARSTVQCAEI